MTEQALFREYVTSGAFRLSLSRTQIAALAMIAEVGEAPMGGHTHNSLHGKGLITMIRADGDHLEYRLTEAGVTALKMLRLAELTQGPEDPILAEITALRDQLDATRKAAQQTASDNWDMRARLDAVTFAIGELRAEFEHRPRPPRPMVSLKDRNPDRSTEEMLRDADALSKLLDEG